MKVVQRVLDAYSLLAYLEGEKGAEQMIEIIKTARDQGRDLLLSAVNWGEVYYITLREAGRERAEAVAQIIETLPIRIVPVDMEVIKTAAEYKATKKMSYADCISAALAKLRKAELVTGDKDFKQVEDDIRILWLK
jgi:ribonuclease VapC